MVISKTERILLIVAYQLSGRKDLRGRRICHSCGMIGDHVDGCELDAMEQWVEGELIRLWREEQIV